MREIGIDISREFPKPLTDEAVEAADVVITMGCGDACPIYSGKRHADWEVEDPAGQPIEVVRRIRDEIRERVQALLGELGVPKRQSVGQSRYFRCRFSVSGLARGGCNSPQVGLGWAR